MSSLKSVFVRDYRAYLEKKRSASTFCKSPNTNIDDHFCKKINTQGQYLLFKTYQVPCQIQYHVPIAKPDILCISCEELNCMYNETSVVIHG